MNKILNRNLNKVTKETVYVIQKDWKDGGEKVVAEVYVDKNLSLSQKIDRAFMETNSIEDAWWNNDDVHAMGQHDFHCAMQTEDSDPRHD